MPKSPEPFDFAPANVQFSLVPPILKTVLGLIGSSLSPLLILLGAQIAGGFAIHYFAVLLPHAIAPTATFALNLLLTTIISAAAIHTLLWASHPQIDEAFSIALRALIPFAAVSIAVKMIVGVGFLLMLLPGMAAFLLLSLAPVFMMAERPSIKDALITSAQISVRYVITLLFVFLAMAVISAVVLLLFVIFGMITSAGEVPGADTADTTTFALRPMILSALNNIAFAATTTACFLHLRASGQRIGTVH